MATTNQIDTQPDFLSDSVVASEKVPSRAFFIVDFHAPMCNVRGAWLYYNS